MNFKSPIISLLVKSVIFALAWLYLPFWIFFLAAVYFYLVPLFRPGRLLLPFAAIIFFSFIEEPSALFAFLFGAIFFLIIGIKDLILINRGAATEALSLLLSFLLSIEYFLNISRWDSFWVVFWAFLAATPIFFLSRLFIGQEDGRACKQGRRDTTLVVTAFLIMQLLIALTFAPLNFLYQSAIFFVFALILLECAADYCAGLLSRRKILLNLSIFFIFVSIILGSAQWGF